MLTYYQPFILPFLHTRPYKLPAEISRAYFVSFEDALWNVLPSMGLPKKSVILIPDFYCMDVVENIRAHGYKTQFYPLDDNFQISDRKLESYRIKYTARVILLFHACGITNNQIRHKTYIRKIIGNTVIIEDAVQRLLDPSRMSVIAHNHIVIDSLRKVSPLNGSFVYGTPETIRRIPKSPEPEILYILCTGLLYLLFRTIFTAGVRTGSSRLVRYAHTRILKAHDDIIGDSTYGHRGSNITSSIHRYIRFGTIEQRKSMQSVLYRKLLRPVMEKNPALYTPDIHPDDYTNLHVYPVGIRNTKYFNGNKADTILKDHGICVWCKFPDAPWSIRRSVLFLPLGFHVEYNEMEHVTKLLA